MIFSACNAKDQGFRLDVNNLGMKEFCQVGKFAANGWRGALNLLPWPARNSHKGLHQG